MDKRQFYQVSSNVEDAPLRDHMFHGYEEREDFRQAVKRLIKRWGGRSGERIGDKHGFFLLKFYDTPGGKPDEAWIPIYLLQATNIPDYLKETDSSDGTGGELTKTFGF